jgi:uncharacterized membrane-anchored protein
VRQVGTTVGDVIDKPLYQGGLAMSRPLASIILVGALLLLIALLPQRAGQHPQLA